jgi:hypothetical protein
MSMKSILGCLVIVIIVVFVIWKWQLVCEDCVCKDCPPVGVETVCGPGTEGQPGTREGDGPSDTVERDVIECVSKYPPTICGAGTKEGDGGSGTVERDVIECEAADPVICGPGTIPQEATVELDGPSGTVERDGFACVPAPADS